MLDTQNDVASELKTWAATFASFSDQLRQSDPDLRGVLDNGVTASKQLAGLLLERHRPAQQRAEQQRADALLGEADGRERLLAGNDSTRGSTGLAGVGVGAVQRQAEPDRLAAALVLRAPGLGEPVDEQEAAAALVELRPAARAHDQRAGVGVADPDDHAGVVVLDADLDRARRVHDRVGDQLADQQLGDLADLGELRAVQRGRDEAAGLLGRARVRCEAQGGGHRLCPLRSPRVCPLCPLRGHAVTLRDFWSILTRSC